MVPQFPVIVCVAAFTRASPKSDSLATNDSSINKLALFKSLCKIAGEAECKYNNPHALPIAIFLVIGHVNSILGVCKTFQRLPLACDDSHIIYIYGMLELSLF